MAAKVFIQDKDYKIFIGTYDRKTKIFYKEVRKSVHFFRANNSWGMDSYNLTKLPDEALIKIYDLENSTTYRVRAKKFKELGQYYHFKDDGVDHITQLFLPVEHWDKETDLEKYLKSN